MPDYSKGKIYTLRCRTDDTLIYVGSTIQSLAVRWGGHKVNSRKEKNRLIYQTINGEWDNWFIELYELYPCSCKEQLCKREGEVIRLIGTLNNNIAGRTNEEYRDENRDEIKEYNKKYRENNADKIKEYQKENRDKIKEYQKEYRDENRDKKKEINKKYREKKKAEKLNSINTP